MGSHFKAWWVCEQGHEWQAIVKSRTLGGCGCPVCAGRVLMRGINDLATTHPELAKQWHPTKNGDLTPRDVVAGNSRKVWWLCPKGHAWQAKVYSRACGGAGCPVCAGKLVVAGENDLESQFPAIAAQWHQRRTERCCPPPYPRTATGGCGGGMNWAMCGKRRCLPEPSTAAGAPIVPGKPPSPASTIWQRWPRR